MSDELSNAQLRELRAILDAGNGMSVVDVKRQVLRYHESNARAIRGDLGIPDLDADRRRLAERVAVLEKACEHFAGCVLTVKGKNTPEWMHYIGHELNDFARAIGASGRAELRHQAGEFWFTLKQEALAPSAAVHVAKEG